MKILVIGLDAATMDLIEPWVQAGHLPVLAHLMREGASARFVSTPNMHSASAWTSILTGMNPGRHGLFVFSDRDFQTGRQEFFTGGDRHAQIISEHLNSAGLRCGLVNVPMTYPADAARGSFMISGLDAPELNENAFSPRELRAEVLASFPDYRFTPAGLGDLMRSGRTREALDAWTELVRRQTDAAQHLISNHAVDFFMIVYTASDWAGHNLWNSREALRSIYESLDDAIARLLKLADESTQVYVISDHGMGRHSNASYRLPDLLCERGLMARSSARGRGKAALVHAKDVATRILPQSVKEKLKTTVGAERVKRLQAAEKDSFYQSIDWSRTLAYSEPGRHVVNINL